MKRRRLSSLLLSAALLGASAPLAAAAAEEGGARGVFTSSASAQEQQQQQSDRISVDELKTLLARAGGAEEVVILDVRGEADAKIKGALHIPLDQLEARLEEIPSGREVVTYCA